MGLDCFRSGRIENGSVKENVIKASIKVNTYGRFAPMLPALAYV
jgi:hypothetical protein